MQSRPCDSHSKDESGSNREQTLQCLHTLKAQKFRGLPRALSPCLCVTGVVNRAQAITLAPSLPTRPSESSPATLGHQLLTSDWTLLLLPLFFLLLSKLRKLRLREMEQLFFQSYLP